MQVFRFNQNEIHFTVSGEGPVVLFLHGFLEDHTMWTDISAEIEGLGFRCFCIDLPCHGLSRFIGDHCSMESMAAIVHAFCSDQNIDLPFIFGHSMGGYVGLELLKLRRAKLTLIHSNFWEDSPEKKIDRNRVIRIVEKNKNLLIREAIPYLFAPANRAKCDPIIKRLIAKASTMPQNEIIAASKGLRDRADNAYLFEQNEINIIQGELDEAVPIKMLREAVENLKKEPQIFLIKNCGHMSIWERPSELINSLKLIVFK